MCMRTRLVYTPKKTTSVSGRTIQDKKVIQLITNSPNINAIFGRIDHIKWVFMCKIDTHSVTICVPVGQRIVEDYCVIDI